MSSFSSCRFTVNKLEGKGNCLVATQTIERGELIFSDLPRLWVSISGYEDGLYCGSCGKCIVESSPPIFPCTCACRFCSKDCLDQTAVNGHEWLCQCIADGIRGILKKEDPSGHAYLALHFYSIVARNIDGDIGRAEIEADSLLGALHRFDSLRIRHAIRSGSLFVDERMFDELIAPTYFSAYLERSLEIIKDVFRCNPMWKGSKGTGDEFIASPIFQPPFYRNLLGTFLSNNLTINVKSTVPDLRSVAHIASTTVEQSTPEPSVVGEEAGANRAADMIGTGIFPTYAMMNHSCLCNTINSTDRSKAEVKVYAGRDIAVGTDILSQAFP